MSKHGQMRVNLSQEDFEFIKRLATEKGVPVRQDIQACPRCESVNRKPAPMRWTATMTWRGVNGTMLWRGVDCVDCGKPYSVMVRHIPQWGIHKLE